jgi:hypothetical protein
MRICEIVLREFEDDGNEDVEFTYDLFKDLAVESGD